MSALSISIAILTLIAGIGIFLVACQMMSSNLESVGSNRLKHLFERVSGSKLLGVGIGTLATAAIQSSGATTVMVIGFVNVGIMSLTQAATIIYGANIGTTITAQIVALGLSSGGGLSTTTIFAAFAGIGAFVTLLAKNDMVKKVGGVLTGFGMLFVGLHMMAGSMGDFAQLDSIKLFLATLDSALLLVLIGAIFTAIVQSSSVVTSIAITMVVTGLVNLNQGIYLTLGSNIGSCVVALIAGLTSGMNAKRTSIIHLLFNCFGVVVFLVAAWVMDLLSGGQFSFGTLFEDMFPDAPQLQLAMFHTIFNITTVVIILPLTTPLVNLVCRIIPERQDPNAAEAPHFFFVDRAMLRTPAIAVRQVKLEIQNMATLAMVNYNRSIRIVTRLDQSEQTEFDHCEDQIDWLHHHLVNYVVELNQANLPMEDHRYLSAALKSISDLERIGDYAENITEHAAFLIEHDAQFPEVAKTEILALRDKIEEVHQWTMKAYMDQQPEAYDRAERAEDEVDDMVEEMGNKHIERLTSGEYTATVGAQYLELATDSERIADHLINVLHSTRVY